MPLMNHYTVEQTRHVTVSAENAAEAALIAAAAFENGQNSDNGVKLNAQWAESLAGISGNTTGSIKETHLNVTKEF